MKTKIGNVKKMKNFVVLYAIKGITSIRAANEREARKMVKKGQWKRERKNEENSFQLISRVDKI